MFTCYKGNPTGVWGRGGAHLQQGFNCYSSRIGMVTEPACKGEVMIVCGEGLDAKVTKVKAFCLGTSHGSFRSAALEDGEAAPFTSQSQATDDAQSLILKLAKA